MIISVHGLAAALQNLLTDAAEIAAQESGFCRRRRKITGAGFVQSLVLGWMGNPKADLDDLAAPLGVTVQSLQERFNDRALDLLGRLLVQAMAILFEARPETIPLLRRFVAVVAEDGTVCSLPASLASKYPGCGGSDSEGGRAGVKLMVRLELITGAVSIGAPAPARDSDRARLGDLPPLPRGSLRLVDLGFFDLERMARDTAEGVSWISRAPARLKVQSDGEPAQNISDWLKHQRGDRVDATVTLGRKGGLTCRLVAIRASRKVAQRRLTRMRKKLSKKGRKLSDAQRIMCEWMVLITNLVDAASFTLEQLWVLYRARWQVELLFKRWKSGGGLGQSRGRIGGRVLGELLAKLLAVLIKHWGTLLRGGPLSIVSATRATKCVGKWAERLAAAAGTNRLSEIADVLEQLKESLDRLPKRPRRKRPTTRQLLYIPRFTP